MRPEPIGDELTQSGSAPLEPSPPAVEPAADDTEAGERREPAPLHVSDARADAHAPTRVGRYLVLERLGAGGMGVVYTAYDPELDRRVAIKLLRTPGGNASVRLLREAQALARLSHPNVVQIHDAGTHGDEIFLAMELVVGEDLRRWLDREPRPWRSIVRVFLEAGRGLAAAHAVGIVHRDFKPQNVLIGSDGRARVADFGLARQVADHAAPAAPSSTTDRVGALDVSLTRSGAIVGTPAYMSPEHHVGGRTDARSDVFSFCVALYEALYRRRPFTGGTVPELQLAILRGAIVEPPPSTSVPRHLFAILRRGLAPMPADRWPSMEALLASLSYDVGARRRGFALATGLVVLASATTYALVSVSTEPDACDGAEAEVAELWSEETRTAVERALVDAAPTAAARDRVVSGLDLYADDWARAREDACLDHRRGDETDAIQAARIRCLDRRRGALEGALRLLRDARAGDDVVRVVAGLPPIDACERIDELMRERPLDPAQATAVAAIEQRLDDARATSDAGRIEAADRAFATAITEAEALGDRGILGQARLSRARVEMIRNDWNVAAATLRLALADALAGGNDPVAAEAVARLLYVRAFTGEERAQLVLADAPIAQAIVDRVGPESFAQRRLWANLGTLHAVAGDPERALEHFVAATEDLAAVIDADPLESANFLRGLATRTHDPEVRRHAFERAEELLTHTLGEDHPELFGHRFYRGHSTLDLAEADEAFASACAGYRRAFPRPDAEREPTCTQCALLRGAIARERDDPAAALAHFDEAARCDPGPAKTPTVQARIDTRRDLALAYAERLRGRPDAALAAVERVLATLAPLVHADAWWLELERAEARLVEGEAHRDRGDRAAALAAFEWAHATLVAHADRGGDALHRFRRARAAVELATLLEQENDPAAHARVRTLVTAARDFQRSRGDAGAARATELDAWLVRLDDRSSSAGR